MRSGLERKDIIQSLNHPACRTSSTELKNVNAQVHTIENGNKQSSSPKAPALAGAKESKLIRVSESERTTAQKPTTTNKMKSDSKKFDALRAELQEAQADKNVSRPASSHLGKQVNSVDYFSQEKPKVTNTRDFVLGPEHMEHPRGVSMTIPGDSYTIPELIQRMSQGLSPLVGRGRATYGDDDVNFDDEDLEKIALMDPSERLMRAAELEQKLDIDKRQLDMFKKEEAEKNEADKARQKQKQTRKESDQDEDDDLRYENEEDDPREQPQTRQRKGGQKH